MEDVAIFPWNRNLWKIPGCRQYAIELLNHVSRILELCGLMEITVPFNHGGNTWSQADHGTAHGGTHRICEGTIWMIGILVPQLCIEENLP